MMFHCALPHTVEMISILFFGLPFSVQVADYGRCLKTGAPLAKRFLTMKVALLKFFLMSGCCNQYARGLICDLLVSFHQYKIRHPIFKLSQADPHCFNEEAGEISLSVLARLNAGMTDKRSLEVMEERFRMTKSSMLIAHFLNPGMRKRLIPTRTKKYHIDPQGKEVKLTAEFFLSVIEACKANQHQTVFMSGKKKEINRRSTMMTMFLKPSALPERRWWYSDEVDSKFNAQIDHIQQKWFDDEYCSFSHEWFSDAFVADVLSKQAEGKEWRSKFDLVPDACTSSDESEESGSESQDEFSADDNGDAFEGGEEDEAPDMQERPDSGETGMSEDSKSPLAGNSQESSDEHSTSEIEDPVLSQFDEEDDEKSGESSGDSDESQSKRLRSLASRQSRTDQGKQGRSSTVIHQRNAAGSRRRASDVTLQENRNKRRRQQEQGFYSLVNQHGSQGKM